MSEKSLAPVTGFKRMEIADVFTPEKIAVFERPHQNDKIVVITIGGETFHCYTGTLELAGIVLNRKS